MVNSRIRVHASLQLDQSHVREFSDMAKSRMRTLEFAQIKRMQIWDIVNSHMQAPESLPLLGKIARQIHNVTNSRARKREILSLIGRAMAQWPKCTIQPWVHMYI
mgnify:CR=1 FL=1